MSCKFQKEKKTNSGVKHLKWDNARSKKIISIFMQSTFGFTNVEGIDNDWLCILI